MVLPKGITGFSHARHDPTPPSCDPGAFTRACHAAARAVGGRVEQIEPATYPRNHHRAILRLGDARIAVLCNARYPWFAFAEASEDLPLRFVTAGPLATRIQDELPGQELSLTMLEAAPDAASLADLGAEERRQIRYWRPERLGDIVFNGWD